MAVGDVVNGLGSAVNTVVNFQPAATVTVMLSHSMVYTGWVFMTNGTLNSNLISSSAFILMKMFVNNTNYLMLQAVGGQTGSFSGIQIE